MIHLGRILLLGLLLALGACADDPRELREQRTALVRQAYTDGEEIHLGAVWPGGDSSAFLAGATLAAEEVNAAGGISGRMLRLTTVDETPFLEKYRVDRTQAEGRYRDAMQEAGTAMAKALLQDPKVATVIGHSDTGQTTLSAMSIYDNRGVVLMSAGTSDELVKWMDSELYFQLLPSDKLMVKELVGAINDQHWDTVHLVFANSRHNEQLAELIKSELANNKITLTGTTSLLDDIVKGQSAPRRLRNSLGELRSGNIDAVILLAPPEVGAQIIRYSRSLGIAQPFIGTMALDSPDFVRNVLDAGEDTIVASIYRDNAYQARRFAEKLRARFPDQVADKWAALGYDSVRFYAQAVACAGTTDPVVVAHALNFKLPLWMGLVGHYAFRPGVAENGAMRVHGKILRRQGDGSFKFVFIEKPAADETLSQ